MIKKNINSIKMIWVKLLVLLIVTLTVIIPFVNFYPTSKIEKNSSMSVFTSLLNERIPTLMNDYKIPGVNIAIVQNGKSAWSKAYGYADLKNKRHMTTDTYCRVQSISKSVTAWGVVKLVEEGLIELDKPVVKYIDKWRIPESEYSVDEVTVRQLLSHCAGMPLGPIGPRACYSPHEDIPSLRDFITNEAVLIQEPGKSFSYSNIGFNLLELLIEEVTGKKFAKYMKEEIFTPLGMSNSSFIWSAELKPEVPYGYDLKGNPVSVYVYPAKAAGDLLSSVNDVATFVAAGMPNLRENNTVINANSINNLHTPLTAKPGVYGLAFDSYGLGHFIEYLSDGKIAVSHGGQGYGLMTHYHLVPQTGDGIVILTNSQRSWPFISYILRDWSKWCGLSGVGMTKIVLGKNLMIVLAAIILFAALWQLWTLIEGLAIGLRYFAPLSKENCFLRSLQFVLFIVIIIGLLWAKSKDYMFITSLFPMVTTWLAYISLIFAIVLFLSSLLPRRSEGKSLKEPIVR